jgi:hypothetical protein
LIAFCFRIKLNKTRGSREALAACHYSYTGKLSAAAPAPPAKRYSSLFKAQKDFFENYKRFLDIRYFWIFWIFWILDVLLDINGY